MNNLKKYLAELIGTFALVLIGCGSAVIAGNYIGFLGISLAFGLTVLAMVYAIGHISGCHINPAITISMFVAGKIRVKDSIAYIIAQCIGAIIAGGILFLTGAYINLRSDNILLSLRKSNSKGYSIPQGGFFKYISCPNFFGEILEWTGFAIMTWSPAALAFAIWTMVNLIPRALDHHRWYQDHFDEYPSERKAIIPKVL